MQNNNNNNNYSTPLLPLKPVAKRTTHIPVSYAPKFVSAREMYENSIRKPVDRSNAILFPHPMDSLISRNKSNLEEVQANHTVRKVAPKRKFEEFISEAEQEGSSDAVAVENYWRHRYGRKVSKIHNIRNRLRAVGLTNIQIQEQLTETLVTVSALKGANSALAFHNTELQEKIAQMLSANEYNFRQMIRVGVEPDSDEELTPTLEELYCDEELDDEEEEVTPTNQSSAIQTVPGAPQKPVLTALDSNNNNISHVPLSSGASEVPQPSLPSNTPLTDFELIEKAQRMAFNYLRK